MRPGGCRRLPVLLVAAGLLLAAVPAARTAGLDGLWPGGWLLPAGAPSRPGGWWAAAGGGRPFGLAALAVRRLAVGRSGHTALFRVRWRQAGSDSLWREDAVDLLWLTGRRCLVGVRLAGEHGSECSPSWSVDLAAALREGDWWALGYWTLVAGGPPGDRLLAAAGMRRQPVTLAGAVWSGGDRPAVAAACWWRPAPSLALGIRMDPDTGEVGFLTTFRRGGTTVRLAWLLHPALGTSRYADVMWGMPADAP